MMESLQLLKQEHYTLLCQFDYSVQLNYHYTKQHYKTVLC